MWTKEDEQKLLEGIEKFGVGEFEKIKTELLPA